MIHENLSHTEIYVEVELSALFNSYIKKFVRSYDSYYFDDHSDIVSFDKPSDLG